MELVDVLDVAAMLIIALGLVGVGFVIGYDEGYAVGYAEGYAVGWNTLLVEYNILVENYEGLVEDYNSLVGRYNRISWAVPVQDLIDQLGYSTEDLSWRDIARFVSLVV